MNRRAFLVTVIATLGMVTEALAANKKFVFKIKTKSGGIIGNGRPPVGDVPRPSFLVF